MKHNFRKVICVDATNAKELKFGHVYNISRNVSRDGTVIVEGCESFGNQFRLNRFSEQFPKMFFRVNNQEELDYVREYLTGRGFEWTGDYTFRSAINSVKTFGLGYCAPSNQCISEAHGDYKEYTLEVQRVYKIKEPEPQFDIPAASKTMTKEQLTQYIKELERIARDGK